MARLMPRGGSPSEQPAPLTAGEKALIGLEVFTGLSGLAGGLAFVFRPDGSVLSMSTSLLSGSPFSDYLVPGLFLTVVVGAGMLAAAFFGLRRAAFAQELSMLCGGGLVAFELVEVSVVGFNPLQAVYGGLGLLILGYSASRWLARRRASQRVAG